MCGILAVASFRGQISQDQLQAGLDSIAHRGPDGESKLIRTTANGGEVGLGHRRLSIFDLSTAGQQPMTDATGRSIVFNGSIFNWPELRKELEGHGYSFVTQTDTEMILAAFDKWGPDCVTRFNGFWAFVIFDDGRNTGKPIFFLSRDRFGIKPMYYCAKSDVAVFASEIKAIDGYLRDGLQVGISELARQLVFQLGDDTDRTIYEGVHELEPATSAVLDLQTGELHRWCYWSLNREAHFDGNDAQVLDRFTELFEDAVRIRLRADREVALLLSGGTDSSAIAVAISRVSAAKVRAFTSHYPDHPEIDESGYAAIVANKLGMEHVLVRPDMSNLASSERMLTYHQEVMYGSFSLLIGWFIIQAIQKTGVRIFLTGQGGDETFLGYERYYAPYLVALARRSPTSVIKALRQAGQNSRLGGIGAALYLLYFSNTWIRGRRYRHDAAQVYGDILLAAARGRPTKLSYSLFDLQAEEVCGQQLRHLLRYDDRTAGAFGTEGRPPFLDHRLVEFAISLDWKHKIRDGWTKYVMRRYLEKAGFPEIAWRRTKLGFSAPTLEWTNNLLPNVGDFSALPAVGQLLRPGLTAAVVPDRMRFSVYNLLSTAREMGWVIPT